MAPSWKKPGRARTVLIELEDGGTLRYHRFEQLVGLDELRLSVGPYLSSLWGPYPRTPARIGRAGGLPTPSYLGRGPPLPGSERPALRRPPSRLAGVSLGLRSIVSR